MSAARAVCALDGGAVRVADRLDDLLGARDASVAAQRSTGTSLITFAQAQGMVDAIWADMGLRFPPKVEPLPRQARSTVADANRLTIRLADTSPSWWLLHELAHAMTCTHDGRSDGHGPKFVGLYAQLLMRYLRAPADALIISLHAAGIDMDIQATPVFMDERPTARTLVDPAASSIS